MFWIKVMLGMHRCTITVKQREKSKMVSSQSMSKYSQDGWYCRNGEELGDTFVEGGSSWDDEC